MREVRTFPHVHLSTGSATCLFCLNAQDLKGDKLAEIIIHTFPLRPSVVFLKYT